MSESVDILMDIMTLTDRASTLTPDHLPKPKLGLARSPARRDVGRAISSAVSTRRWTRSYPAQLHHDNSRS